MHQTVTERTETMMDPALSIQSRDVLFVAHQEHVDQFLCWLWEPQRTVHWDEHQQSHCVSHHLFTLRVISPKGSPWLCSKTYWAVLLSTCYIDSSCLREHPDLNESLESSTEGTTQTVNTQEAQLKLISIESDKLMMQHSLNRKTHDKWNS